MQDVCVSSWPENGSESDYTNDVIGKITDICSTDPNDPSHCTTPSDIKVDRAKVQVMYAIPVPRSKNADLQKDKYVKGTYLHLTKCWANVRGILTYWPDGPHCPLRAKSTHHRLTPIRRFPSPPIKTTGGPNPLFSTTFSGTSTPRGSR